MPGRRPPPTPTPPARNERGRGSRPVARRRPGRGSPRAKGSSRGASPERGRATPISPRELPELERWLADELHQKAARHRRADAKQRMQELFAAVESDDVEQALRSAERAKGAAPHSPSVREALGLISYATEDFKRALAELQAFRRMTGDRSHDPRIADCYRALGRPEKAVELLEDLGPDDVGEEDWIDGLIVRAEATAETGNLAGAVAVLAVGPLDAVEIHDRHRRLWQAYGEMLERSGRHDEARTWLQRVAIEAPELSEIPED